MELKSLSLSLKDIMNQALAFVKERRSESLNIEIKAKNSLVTQIDKELERFFVDELTSILPESGFIAEEGTSDKKGKNYNWIIDPLDGTTNFIHGIPSYCSSIALSLGNDIVLGGIIEHNSGEYFEAYKSSGAFLNGEKIQVSNTKTLEHSLIATGFPYYDFNQMNSYIEVFKELMVETRGIRRIGTAALDLAYVACGRFDGFFEYSLHPWDVAAGILIIEEAGGKTSDFKGEQNQLFGKEMLACNEEIYDDMLEKMKRHFT